MNRSFIGKNSREFRHRSYLAVCRVLLIFVLFVTYYSKAHAEDIFRSSGQALKHLKSNVRKITLENGLRVILYPRKFAPVFSGVVSVGVGGVDESIGSTGISHMFEHMAFKGTSEIGTKDYAAEKPLLEELEKIVGKGKGIEEFTAGERVRWQEIHTKLAKLWRGEQFSEEYERRGAVGLNAHTDKEETRYYVSLPKNSFEFWCYMESERLLRPVMRQFYQERDVVLEERRMRFDDDPMGKLYEMFITNAFRLHPYKLPVIGFENDIKKLTATKLQEFAAKYYVPANIVLGLVGDIDIERDLPIVERYFGRLPLGRSPERTKIIEPRQTEEKRFSIEQKAGSAFMVGYHKPVYPNDDDPPVSLLEEILAGSKQSPLYEQLVKRGRLATSVSIQEVPGVKYPNLFVFTVVTKSPFKNATVLRRFDEVLTHFLDNGSTEEQLDIAKRSVASSYLGQMKSSAGLAGTLAASEVQFGSWEVMVDWYEKAMKVTTADIDRVAKRYITPTNRVVGFLEEKEPQ